MEEKHTTKETILKIAYDIFSKSGVLNTIKEIADQAGVNIAAINYYFGSKENLIKLLTEIYYDELRGLLSILENSNKHPLQRLREYINIFMNFNDSQVHRNVMAKAIIENGKMEKFTTVVIEHVAAFRKVIKEITGEQDEYVLSMKVMLFAAAIEYPRLLNNYAIEPLKTDFDKPETREKYIDMILDTIINIPTRVC